MEHDKNVQDATASAMLEALDQDKYELKHQISTGSWGTLPEDVWQVMQAKVQEKLEKEMMTKTSVSFGLSPWLLLLLVGHPDPLFSLFKHARHGF